MLGATLAPSLIDSAVEPMAPLGFLQGRQVQAQALGYYVNNEKAVLSSDFYPWPSQKRNYGYRWRPYAY